MPDKNLIILGTRGIPGRYGGFETFSEKLSLYLIQQQWSITVYCQSEDIRNFIQQDVWHDIHRVTITPKIGKKLIKGAYGTILFDCLSFFHALKHARRSIWLTLGYNTAFLNILPKFLGIKQIINMDGMEWQRDKWSGNKKIYLYIMHFIAGYAADILVADHPEIEKELQKNFNPQKIMMIPYGSLEIKRDDNSLLNDFNLRSDDYCLIIARPVPENGILEIVEAWEKVSETMKLVIVGAYDDKIEYQRKVQSFSSENIIFTGPIYDQETLTALRCGCYAYFHGYSVGGTNPSLVEALGSGAGIIAADNRFNRWVVDNAGLYYGDKAELISIITKLKVKALPITELRKNATKRHQAEFQWMPILKAYEKLFKNCL